MREQKKLSVIIIGAGLSGLLTGYRLKNAGVAIKILEARDRPGGRIHTVGGAEGPPLEMGATWFGNQHQHLKDLLKELKISDFKQNMEGSVIFEASPNLAAQRIDIPPQDPSFRIVGGTNRLIKALLDFFSNKEIFFKEQVEKIKVEDGQLKIKTNNQTFSAKRVVCCIPPALLVNSIKFVPELPEPISRIAKSTHTWMQESIKAGVVYKTPFWKDIKISTIVSNQGPVIEYYDHSDYTNSKYALCGFVHPDYANQTREEREERIISQLKRLFGEEAREYTGYEEVVWQHEKFTNANTEEDFLPHQNNGNRIFQEPLYNGKVFISNSETSALYGGYMEGAVYVANQVAKRILEKE